MFKSQPMFYIFSGLSLGFAIVTGIYGMYVFFAGGAVIDFSAVCAFGATACSFGILARLEQAAMHYYQPDHTNILEQTSEVPVDPNICRNCGNLLEDNQKFCQLCGTAKLVDIYRHNY